ncbi:hypothetical protein D4764_17G0007450 [Takifugu flavidus]|uniref:Uncharacterized protein n=1 Tax=Takifugu flavidus TaxID=433684 RepID=A0A5C6NUV6_9TELE|nr:hypothetical protein D4764_17G0007450 [Takifugu flavidus]
MRQTRRHIHLLPVLLQRRENQPVKAAQRGPPAKRTKVRLFSSDESVRPSVSQLPLACLFAPGVQGVCKHGTGLDGEQLRSANFPIQTSKPAHLPPLPPPSSGHHYPCRVPTNERRAA